MTRAVQPCSGYQIFTLALCLYSLANLTYQASRPVDPSIVTILEYADFSVVQ